jgi:hypothetical protein
MKYRLFVPKQAVGADLVYFDLFNASGSASEVRLLSVLPIVSGAVAVSGLLGVDLFLTRTTAVGTGGTAATSEGTSLTAATFSGHDSTQPIHSSITARLTPSGGATAGAVLSWRSVFTEETSDATYTAAVEMARQGMEDVGYMLIPENSGIRVVQGNIASVGNIGFGVIFDVRPKGGS